MQSAPLALFATAAVTLAGGCTGGPGTAFDPAVVARGREVFRSEGCVACHGPDRNGTAMAPPLHRLSRHWDEDSLRAFLLDPPRMIPGDARLRRLSRAYPAQMPALFAHDSDRLDALVAYLLAAQE